jgi:hypothetical protein
MSTQHLPHPNPPSHDATASHPFKALLQRFKQEATETNEDWRRIIAHLAGSPAQKVEHLTALTKAGFDAPTYHRQALETLLQALKAENAALRAAQHHNL